MTSRRRRTGFRATIPPKFLPNYIAHRVFKDDPFQVLDREGVGQLVRIATERGRATRPRL